MNEPKILILCGGGLDSGVMAAKAAAQMKSARLLFFHYGQKAWVGEWRATETLALRFDMQCDLVALPRLLIPSSPLTEGLPILELSQQSRNEVKGRNLMFLALAFSLAHRYPSIKEIWIGSDRPAIPPGFGDQKQAMFDGFNITTAFAYGEDSPRVVAPLLAYQRKVDFLFEALEIYPELFKETFSCYESSGFDECGRCNHCQVKQKTREELERM